MNKKLIAPIVTAAAMLATSIGSTFALFTSNASSKININSGKVDIDSIVNEDSLKVYSASTISTLVIGDNIAGSEEITKEDSRWESSGQDEYKADYFYERQTEEYSGEDGEGFMFSTRGHVALDADGKHVTIDKMAPGDRVLFNMIVTNNSNIDIKYRVKFALDEDPSLYNEEHTLADARLFESELKYSWGDSSYSKWHNWSAESVVREKTLWFDFELPILTTNEVQDKLAYFKFDIEAVQGNAYTSDPVEEMEVAKKVVEEGQDVDLKTKSASVNVPGDAVPAGTELHLEVEPDVNGGFNFVAPTAGTIKSFDVTVVDEEGNKVTEIATPDTVYTGSIYLGVVELSKFYHLGEELELCASKEEISLTKAFYDNNPASADYGWIFFKTKSFSPFTATYAFAGGINTEEYPYLIETFDQFKQTQNINVSLYQTRRSYYKFVADIEMDYKKCYRVTSKGYTYRAFNVYGMNADYDGDGHMLTMSTDGENVYPYLFYQAQNLKLHNLKVTIADQGMILNGYNGLIFEDVDVYGYLNVANNTGAYIIYSNYGGEFIDCDSYCNIVGYGIPGSYNAIYVGYTFGDLLTFTNCHNKGSIVCGKAVMFVGNIHNSYKQEIVITNCSNDGLIQWTDIATSSGTTGYYNQIIAGSGQCISKVTLDGIEYTTKEQIVALEIPTTGEGKNVWGPQDATLAINKNANDTFEITEASNENAVKYQVVINTYAGANGGGSLQVSIDIEFDKDSFTEGKYDSGLKELNFVDQYWVEAHPEAEMGTLAGVTIYTLNGVSYYYVNLTNAKFGSSGVAGYTSVSVSCYDANGTPLAAATYLKTA